MCISISFCALFSTDKILKIREFLFVFFLHFVLQLLFSYAIIINEEQECSGACQPNRGLLAEGKDGGKSMSKRKFIIKVLNRTIIVLLVIGLILFINKISIYPLG